MNNSVSTMTGKTKIKIVLLGNQAVGKSSIIEKYVKDIFDDSSNPTVGIDFLVKNVTHRGKNYRLQLWDTAGQERFRSLIPNYLKDAKCALIIIDVTSKASLNNADAWLSLYNDNKTGEGHTFLIGNKIDLEHREVTQQQGKKKAQEMGVPYFQVSAKTGANIESFFNRLIDLTQDQALSPTHYQAEARKKPQSNTIKQQNKEEEEEDQTKNTNGKNLEETTNNIVLKNQKKLEEQAKKAKQNGGCC